MTTTSISLNLTRIDGQLKNWHLFNICCICWPPSKQVSVLEAHSSLARTRLLCIDTWTVFRTIDHGTDKRCYNAAAVSQLFGYPVPRWHSISNIHQDRASKFIIHLAGNLKRYSGNIWERTEVSALPFHLGTVQCSWQYGTGKILSGSKSCHGPVWFYLEITAWPRSCNKLSNLWPGTLVPQK